MTDQPDDEHDAVEHVIRGRPSPYKPEFADQARKLARLGATDIEIADFFEVDVRTIYRWKHSNEDFCQALIAGKDALDERVVRSLYQRAVGYTFESEKLFRFEDKVIRAETLEHVPPDPGAAMSWLKNRRPAEWRERVEVNHMHDLTDRDVLARHEELMRRALEEQAQLQIEGTARDVTEEPSE